MYVAQNVARRKTRALSTDLTQDLIRNSLPRTQRLSPAAQEQLTNLYRLGPRVVAEALLELAERTGSPAWVAQRLDAYAGMDPKLVAAVGAGDFGRRAR